MPDIRGRKPCGTEKRMKRFSREAAAETVRSKRLEKGYSQTELGDRTGINRAMISRLEIPHYNIPRPRPGVRSSLECARRIMRMMEVNSI